MTTTDINQTAIALACILDAALSAVDPSGVSLRRACRHLNEGLHLAEQSGAANYAAADIVRAVVANLKEMETVN